MTISSATRKAGPFLGNGVTTSFPFTFKVFEASDLQVIKTSVDGIDATLALDGQYSVSLNVDQNASPGGTITYPISGAPLAANEKLTVTGVLTALQQTHITNGGNFFANNIEDQMDYLTILVQQLAEQMSRVALASSSDINPVLSIGTALQRANTFISFDASGNLSLSLSLPAGTLSQANIVSFLGADPVTRRTAGEIAAGVVPVNLAPQPGNVVRYGPNTTPGTTDMQPAIQRAIDSADLTYPVVSFTNTCAIGKPLLIGSSSVENLSLVGAARTISLIEPAAVDIRQPAQDINALIINQINNGHLHLRHIRALAQVAYTGYIMYAIEGGCLDGSAQAAFSMVVDDCWFSLSSQNVGYFRGGFSNLKALNCVWETSKDACWILEGGGNGDLQFIGHQMFICFDNFIRASDSNVKSLISVIGLHAYNHQRGRLLEFNLGQGLIFDDIILEPDAANLGNCGLFKLTDCSNVMVSNFSMAARSGVPAGEVGIEIINGCTGKFVNGLINATTGLSFSGAGVLDLEFVNVDFTGCTMCWAIAGTQTGNVRFINCKMSNAQQRCISDAAGTAAFNVEFIGGEIKNAGLGGNAAFRNILITSAGNWTFRGTTVGQDNVAAVAADYIDANGSGTVKFLQPVILGTPPTAIKVGPQFVYFEYERGYAVIASANSLLLPSTGDTFSVSGTTGIATIQAGTNDGRRVTLIFQDIVTVTDGSNLKLATSFTSVASGTLSLVCDGTNWYETSRSAN